MSKEKKETSESDIVFEESSEDAGEIKTDAVKKLKEKLKQCLEEKQEYLNGWQRMKADSINLKKEEEKKRQEIAGFVKEDIINQLLPVLNSFDIAFKNKEAWESVGENWRKGVEYIYSQLAAVLENNGLMEINPSGALFDPRCHISVETVITEKEEESGKIAHVLQKGYKVGDIVIRPARVSVFEYKK